MLERYIYRKLMLNLRTSFLIILSLFIIVFVFEGCVGEPAENQDDIIQADIDTPASLHYRGKTFSVPTHAQIAGFIKKHKGIYDRELISNPNKSSQFITKFQQAVNLGVYAADLSYISVFEQYGDGTADFDAIKQLSLGLDIYTIHGTEFLERLKKYGQNQDSLIVLLSRAYKNMDRYLLQNKQDDVSALIISGGWTESMYLLVHVGNNTNSAAIDEFIADQKYPLDNVIELLKPYYGKGSNEFDNYVDKLLDLALLYDGVVYSYEFKKSITDAPAHHTRVRCKNKVVINQYQLDHIKTQIEDIRKLITKTN